MRVQLSITLYQNSCEMTWSVFRGELALVIFWPPYSDALSLAKLKPKDDHHKELTSRMFINILSDLHKKLNHLIPAAIDNYDHVLRHCRKLNVPLVKTEILLL